MTIYARFFVSGRPIAQPRHRVGAVRFGGGTGRAYIPDEHAVHGWRGAITVRAREEKPTFCPVSGPVALVLLFTLPKLARRPPHYPWHHVRPDLDNMEKAAKDAMTGVFWEDDGQVAVCFKWKCYAQYDTKPGVLVSVGSLDSALEMFDRDIRPYLT